MNHQEQVDRIKRKLDSARNADKKFKTFGAESHRYRIGPPLSHEQIKSFENKYSIKLPECYRAFVSNIGNGGKSYRGSAAGPYYGIYPLGRMVDEIVTDPMPFLKALPSIHSTMSDEAWEHLTRALDGDLAASKYQQLLGTIYSGALPIGSQGCAYLHTLVLNGPDRGRVVNLDLEHSKPKFAFEANFLDWYERWLDEVISGILQQDEAYCFGYTMGGDAHQLLKVFDDAEDATGKLDALSGLGRLPTVSEDISQRLLQICQNENAGIRHQALELLTKFAYPLSVEPLKAHLQGDEKDRLAACQSIYWHARKDASDWTGQLLSRLSSVSDVELFRFITYLLIESESDFSFEMRDFFRNPDEDLRIAAFYSLGRLSNKADKVEYFLWGLSDPCPEVVHTSIQALEGVRAPALLDAYHALLARFKTDKYYIRTNLELRLQEFGFKSIKDFQKSHSTRS